MFHSVDVWSMKWRVPEPEVDQRGPGETLYQKNCQAHNLNREDAVDHNMWRMLIKDG